MEDCPQEIALQVMSGYVNRAFIICSEAWWYASTRRDDIVQEFNIGFYHPFDEGTYGEFIMDWQMLGGELTGRIKLFSDFWHLTPLIQDFMTILASVGDIPPADMAEKMIEIGFVDHTQRDRGDKKPPQPDFARQRLQANRPQRVHEAFRHLFDPNLPFVVGFSGTTTFDKGVLIKNPDISAFVDTNCRHAYRCYKNDVLFESEEDALLVQMRFS